VKGCRHIGYTSDAYDLFGVGHLDQLRAARADCDFLIVGVHCDDLVLRTTGEPPVIPFDERLAIARAMRSVDAAIGQLSDDLLDVWDQLRFDRLFVLPRSAVAPTYAGLRQMGVDIVVLDPRRVSAGGEPDPIRAAVPASVPTPARRG